MKNNYIKDMKDILNIVLDKYQDIQICNQYGEPGYDNEDKQILLDNWNPIMNKYPNIFEHLEQNYCIEWSDEWIINFETSTCYRTSPDCYQWQPSYIWLDDCTICGMDELLDDNDIFESWMEQYINNTNNAINLNSIPTDQLNNNSFNLAACFVWCGFILNAACQY